MALTEFNEVVLHIKVDACQNRVTYRGMNIACISDGHRTVVESCDVQVRFTGICPSNHCSASRTDQLSRHFPFCFDGKEGAEARDVEGGWGRAVRSGAGKLHSFIEIIDSGVLSWKGVEKADLFVWELLASDGSCNVPQGPDVYTDEPEVR